MDSAMTPLPVQESLRASCDRCRAKKLACVVSTAEQSRFGGQQCERCIRARLECVFSRRAQRRSCGGAQRANKGWVGRNPPKLSFGTKDEKAPKATISCTPNASEPLSGSSFSANLSDWEQNGPGFADIDEVTIFDTNISPFMNDENHIVPPNPFADLFGMPSFPNMSESIYKSPIPILASPESSLNSSRDTVSTIEKPHYFGSSKFLKISVLITDIHKTFLLLSRDIRTPSLTNDEEDLDTYPIGPVLDLARRFAAEVRGSWSQLTCDPKRHIRYSSSGSTAGMDMSNGSEGQKNPLTILDPSLELADVLDLPTKFLTLSCYASLAKLYIIIFVQIHMSLFQIPESTSYRRMPALFQREGDPKSENPFPVNVESCSKMYIVVQMLLDEFQSVEDVMSSHNQHDLDTQIPELGYSQLSEVQQQSERNVNIKSSWLNQQLQMIKVDLKHDTSQMFSDGSQDPIGLLQQGHCLKNLLRESMNL